MAIRLKTYFEIINKNWLRIILTILGVTLALFCLSYLALYLLQNGDIHLKQRVFLDDVYFDMWKHLIHLDITADKKAIGPEAFIVNGKIIAYFLPFPALVRGILSIFHLGAYPVLSMLLGFLVFVIYSEKIFLLTLKIVFPESKINPFIKYGWLIFIAFGSPFLSVMENSSTYWEAIIWGAAMYMVCLYLSTAILSMPRNISLLAVFSLVCGLTLFTRPTFTVGAALIFGLTIVMLFVNLLKPNGSNIITRHHIYRLNELIGAAVIFVVFGVLLGALNFARWGNPFEFQPLNKNVQYMGNSRATNFDKYGSMRLDRIPQNTAYYFFPSKDNFSSESPFIQSGHTDYFVGLAKNFDYLEPTLPIPLILPVYFLLTIFGLVVFIWNMVPSFRKNNHSTFPPAMLPAAISAFVPGLLLLPYTAEVMRYAGDFTPGIMFFSIYAIVIILGHLYPASLRKQKEERSTVILNVVVIGMLLFISLYMTTAGLLIQRQYFSKPWPTSSQSNIASSFPALFSQFTHLP